MPTPTRDPDPRSAVRTPDSPPPRGRRPRWPLAAVLTGLLLTVASSGPLTARPGTVPTRAGLDAGRTGPARDVPAGPGYGAAARPTGEPAPAGTPTVPAAGGRPGGRPGGIAGPTGRSDPTPHRPPSTPAPVLRLTGPVPAAGQGSFRYGTTLGPVLGRAGELRSFQVAVERGAAEDVTEFGQAVENALADPRSWPASGRLRLQRVPAGAHHDFTVYLATAATAGRMCAAGGVNIEVGGRPYTSCRAPGKVIINLDRWRRSVDHFVAAGVPLDTYRRYVVNHEVGHELGHHHERCPGRGKPAPVMMQQTLFLRGCVANPWPYLGGRRHQGPPL